MAGSTGGDDAMDELAREQVKAALLSFPLDPFLFGPPGKVSSHREGIILSRLVLLGNVLMGIP